MQRVSCMGALRGEREEVKLGLDRNRERKGTAGEGTEPGSSSGARSRASAGLCPRPKGNEMALQQLHGERGKTAQTPGAARVLFER